MKVPKSVENILHGISIEKTSTEIRDAVAHKAHELQRKIAEREKRVAQLREEYGIDDKALIQLLTAARTQSRQAYAYTTSAASGGSMEERTIGAGVVNNLLTESDFVEQEKLTVERLQLIERNIRPIPARTQDGVLYECDSFTVSYADLEFLDL